MTNIDERDGLAADDLDLEIHPSGEDDGFSSDEEIEVEGDSENELPENGGADHEFSDALEDSLFDNPWDFIQEASAGLNKVPRESLIQEQQRDPDPESPSFDYLDFEGPEQVFFVLLKSQIRKACNVNSPTPERHKAASWIFCSTDPMKQVASFSQIIRALGGRKQVIQARVHYQLYAAGIPFAEPLPFLCDKLPEGLYAELLAYHGTMACDLGRLLWTWPGVRADMFLAEAVDRLGITEDAFHENMRRMERTGHVALKHGFWYFISRNPDTYTLEGRRRFQWSKAFVVGFDH